MTLQQVLDFLAIVEHGSLHAAARASGQTQPALTKSLRRLEATLGTPLLDRHAKGVQPNPFGHAFLGHARRLAADAQRAREAVAQQLGERHGRVEIGLSVAAVIWLLAAAIKRYRREYPAVELRTHSGLYHQMAPLLRDARLDFFVAPVPADAVDPLFSTRSLIRSRMALVARREHPLARVRSLAALQAARFVIGGPPGQPGGGIHAVFTAAGLAPPTIELRTDGLIDSAAMVAGSDCIALLPEALMKSGLLRERLVVVPVAEDLPEYEVALFRRTHVPLTPAAEALAVQLERESEYRRR